WTADPSAGRAALSGLHARWSPIDRRVRLEWDDLHLAAPGRAAPPADRKCARPLAWDEPQRELRRGDAGRAPASLGRAEHGTDRAHKTEIWSQECHAHRDPCLGSRNRRAHPGLAT